MGIAPTELSYPDGDPADAAVVGPLVLPSSRRRRGLHLPGWLRLLLSNRKSCAGIVVFAGIVAAARNRRAGCGWHLGHDGRDSRSGRSREAR